MRELLDVIQEISNQGITFGTSGNASCRNADNPIHYWITPSGVNWALITDKNLVRMQVGLKPVIDGRFNPSTEWRLHNDLYENNSWVGGIVHLHSTYATILSTLSRPVYAVHYQMARVADEVPLLDYHAFGTQALADEIVRAIHEDCRAVLLQNHGLVAVGNSVAQAYQSALEVEWTAMIQYRASLLGIPRILNHHELEAVRKAFQDYGQPG